MPWIDDELQTLHLGDRRLQRRARLLLQRLYADPQASLNAACQGWAETQAAYRFFDNPKVRPHRLLQPHHDATLRRIDQHPVVLVVQDTTELDYSAHPATGTGPLSSEQQRGFLDHTHLALTPEGLCLGVLAADLWARSDQGFGNAKQRQYDPLETKETYRWLQGYRLACRTAAQVPHTQIISVADCEGDLYEVFVEAQQAQAPARADYVIRLGKNRSLTEPDPEAGADAYRKVRQEMASAPVVATRSLALPRTPKRAPRTATLEIRAQAVTLKAPYRKERPLPDLTVHVVWVREIHTPAGVEPIEWLLVTSLPIDTAAAVLQVVDYYTGRWPVEVYFRVYKSGCRVEEVQLETAERLLPCLMLYKIVAWRVLYVMALGRELPELPCDVVFAAQEWKPVWCVTQQAALPEQAPRLGEFVGLLGRLGGHNGRRGEGPPGAEALWRGVRRMTDLALAWQTFGPETHRTPPPAKKKPPAVRREPKGYV
jgi:Transposase DNA-binding/Transposase Tn5 dimerisation domain